MSCQNKNNKYLIKYFHNFIYSIDVPAISEHKIGVCIWNTIKSTLSSSYLIGGDFFVILVHFKLIFKKNYSSSFFNLTLLERQNNIGATNPSRQRSPEEPIIIPSSDGAACFLVHLGRSRSSFFASATVSTIVKHSMQRYCGSRSTLK